MLRRWKTSVVMGGCAAALALSASAGEPACCTKSAECTSPVLKETQDRVLDLIKYQTFMMLPEQDRETITAKLGVENLPTIERSGEVENPWADLESQPEEKFQKVAEFVDRETFYSFEPIHQRMLVTVVERVEEGVLPPYPCFKEGTDPKLVGAFQAAAEDGIERLGERFQQTNRWTGTALDPGGGGQGNPTTLTYSYVPDGTFVPNLIGVTGNSDLFSWLNGIYGNPATWQTIFDEVFADWGDLSGNTYIYEPNDDGVNLNQNAGVSGVRGDLRIAAIFIDGNSGTLAYNNFPNDGDMVFDSGDNFYNNTSNNSQGFRNVTYHEHGHGFGALHVCPITQTKLMEPFISFNFFGPQLDDILNIQRHYGDRFEPNDSSGQATNLGSFSVNGTTTETNISSDDNADDDWYQFTLTTAKQVTATMEVVGGTYDSSVQSGACGGAGNCCSGNLISTQLFNDLGIEFIDSDGSTVLVSDNDDPAGTDESVNIANLAAGTYYIRVFAGSSNNIQAYNLIFNVDDTAFVEPDITLVGGPPASIDPGVPTVFNVTIDPGDDIVFAGSETLFYRFSIGAYSSVPLQSVGGNDYTATLPAAACADSPEYYIQANSQTTGVITEPAGGGGAPFSSLVGTFSQTLVDDAETDIGWTVGGTASDGQWDRGVPVNAGRGDPPSDADGSGQAWLTDNDAANGGNSDVDNGTTTLTSPVFDLSNGATVSYQYWLNDIVGGEINGDSFDVEISTDGGSNFSLVRSYTTVDNSWRSDTIEVGTETATSSTVVFRFTAEDVGTQNVIEGGLDDFRISELTCTDPPTGACSPADVTTTGAGSGDPGFGVPDGEITAADLNFFVNAWVASDASVADVTTTGAGSGDPGFGVPDGDVTAADLNFFVNLWVQGCP